MRIGFAYGVLGDEEEKGRIERFAVSRGGAISGMNSALV